MLTIARKAHESIIITTPDGDELRIVVHTFEGNQIKVSIEASTDYRITREELLEDSFV